MTAKLTPPVTAKLVLDGKIDATREALEGKIDRLYHWVIPLQITTILAIAGLGV